MSETQFGAPAVASDDPANLAGPGVTANPPDSEPVFDLARVSEENARLRSDLLAENDRLKAALAESRLAGAEAQGLTDEDVRRLEHPEEYVAEYAALGEHEALRGQFASLAERFSQFQTVQEKAASDRAAEANGAAAQAVPAPEAARTTDTPLDQLSDDELTAELERRRQAQ